MEYYFGTTGGGVFKTTDGGMTWSPVTDKYFGGTIGSIAVSESNPDVVYVGTGESPIRGNVSHGDGVFKSTDAGKTWSFVGLGDTRQIGRVRIHPRNPDIAYVSALGHVYGPNAERGVFKTTDGGKTWRKVLFRSDSAEPSILSSTRQIRKPCTPPSGTPTARRGSWSPAGRRAESSSRLTAASTGVRSLTIQGFPEA